MVKSKKRSISFTVTDEMEDYLNKLSDKMGMNRSAVITMIINQYKLGTETVKTLNDAINLAKQQENKNK